MKLVVVFSLMLVVSQSLAKGDDGLYDDVAPPGSAFVRMLNVDNSPLDSGMLNDTKLDKIDACNTSPYIFYPAGDLRVVAGKNEQHFALEADQFYTVVYKHGQATLLKDRYYKNRMKSLVTLYNMLDANTVNLTANGGKVPVFESVAQGERVEREINAMSIALELQPEGGTQLLPGKQNFTRGDVFSLFVCGDKDSIAANWVKWSVIAPE